jgi:hypothetical protein
MQNLYDRALKDLLNVVALHGGADESNPRLTLAADRPLHAP